MQSVSIGQRTPEGTIPQSKKWPAERERGPRSGQPRAVLALFTQIRMLGQSKKKKKVVITRVFFQWVLLLAVLQAHICNTKQ